MIYQVWEGDLFLYSVDTKEEADEQVEAGFYIIEEDELSVSETVFATMINQLTT